jgi:hypothetical protein
MNKKTNLLVIFFIFLISLITVIFDQKTSLFKNLTLLLFLQFIYSIFLNIFLLKYIFTIEVIISFFNQLNILLQYFLYTLFLFLSMFLILSFDFTDIKLLGIILSLLFLFVFSFLTQLLIYTTICKTHISSKVSVYFSAISMFILFILLIIPRYLQ